MLDVWSIFQSTICLWLQIAEYNVIYTTPCRVFNLLILTFPQFLYKLTKNVGRKSKKRLACGLMWVYNRRSGTQIKNHRTKQLNKIINQ